MSDQFKVRQTEDMSDQFFRFGDGKISGYVSCFLGSLSILAVLCYRYPEFLTTPELRAAYDADMLREVLKYAMWTSICFGLLTFVLNKRKKLGAIGILATLLAFALGGYGAKGHAINPTQYFAGLDWLVLDLLLTTTVFIFIEKVLPKYRDQAILRPEWAHDLIYFGFNHLTIGLMLLIANGFAPVYFNWAVNAEFQAMIQGMPLLIQLVLILLAADLAQYWAHRLFHTVPTLWKFHAVHHSTENMDWLAGSRTHFFDSLIIRSMVMLPVYLLGANKEAFDLYVIFASFQAVFNHANVGVNFGPLKYLLVTPQFHHWHHSADEVAIDMNYAAHLPVLDVVFGTSLQAGQHWPEKYGTVGEPLPRGIIKQHLYPFRPSPKSLSPSE